MGYDRNHAIVVSSWSLALLTEVRERATGCGNRASEIIKYVINDGGAFMVAPDGSKEGWEESEKGDAARAKFLQWADSQRYADGSTPLRWAEVQFADDERVSIVTKHFDEPDRWLPGELT